MGIECKTGSIAERSSIASRRHKAGLRNQRMAYSLAISLTALLTTAPVWAEQDTASLGLRGSSNAYSAPAEVPPPVKLRGASHQAETDVYEDDGATEHVFTDDDALPGLMEDSAEPYQRQAEEKV